MKQGYGIVRAGVVVFRVLAWVSLVVQVVVGLILLVEGGEPVSVGGVEVPARVVGALNCVAGGIYCFMLLLMASVLRLLLEVRERPSGGSST